MKESWKKNVYIAKKISATIDDYGNEVVTYSSPVKYRMNHHPVSAEVDLVEFGEKAKQMQRAVISIRDKNIFKENDLVYLDGATPEGEQENGDNANYRAYPPRIQNKVVLVYFERLSGK